MSCSSVCSGVTRGRGWALITLIIFMKKVFVSLENERCLRFKCMSIDDKLMEKVTENFKTSANQKTKC
jgi:hypothetical protein